MAKATEERHTPSPARPEGGHEAVQCLLFPHFSGVVVRLSPDSLAPVAARR
jgi:hypothetical protein